MTPQCLFTALFVGEIPLIRDIHQFDLCRWSWRTFHGTVRICNLLHLAVIRPFVVMVQFRFCRRGLRITFHDTVRKRNLLYLAIVRALVIVLEVSFCRHHFDHCRWTWRTFCSTARQRNVLCLTIIRPLVVMVEFISRIQHFDFCRWRWRRFRSVMGV